MYPKTFYHSAPRNPQHSDCFVLMPFAKEFDDVYDAIAEAAHEVNFFCRRADDVYGGGHIMEDILKGIGNAEIVIADLTSRNPNVFYELGIAHMVKDIEKVILITQDMEDVPFDLRQFRCVVYEQSPRGFGQLKRDIAKAINEITEGVFRFPVKDGQPYEFPDKVFGIEQDRAAYSFEIPEIFTFHGGAKFRLVVKQYVVGRSPKVVSDDAYGIQLKEKLPISHIPWVLILDGVSRGVAYFCLVPAARADM